MSIIAPQLFAIQENPEPHNQAQLAELLFLFRVKDALLVSKAAARDEEFALVILKLPGVDVNSVDGSGKTALHYAAQFGLEKLADKLLELGADKKLVDDQEKTPLKLAQENKHAKIVALLRKA